MNVEVDTIQKYADEWGEKNGRKVEVIHQSPSVQQFAQAVKSASRWMLWWVFQMTSLQIM